MATLETRIGRFFTDFKAILVLQQPAKGLGLCFSDGFSAASGGVRA
jgi:hypothetical protein